MQLKLNQLAAQLKKGLAPVYLISGEDLLLKQEARDAVIHTALSQGFDSRECFQVESRFDWNILNTSLSNQDLFAEKKIIEITNLESKFDTAASKALTAYLEKNPADSLLIIIAGKLNSTQLRSTWYQHIEKRGICLTIWPLNNRELETWVHTRFQQAQLKASGEAVKLLAELCENNLLAAQQAIEKLKLNYPLHSIIEAQQVMQIVSDSSRYTAFDLINYILQANSARSLHVLAHLKQQAIEPTLILWALGKEIRLLLELTQQQEQGLSVQKLIDRENFNKRPLLQLALRRVNSAQLRNLLAKLSELDQIIKGMSHGDIWLELSRLSLALSGKGAFT